MDSNETFVMGSFDGAVIFVDGLSWDRCSSVGCCFGPVCSSVEDVFRL